MRAARRSRRVPRRSAVGASGRQGLWCSRAKDAPDKSSGPAMGCAMSAVRKEGGTSRRFAAQNAAGSLVPDSETPADSRFHNPAVARRASLMQEPVLVLNATYEPINVTAVRRAMVL